MKRASSFKFQIKSINKKKISFRKKRKLIQFQFKTFNLKKKISNLDLTVVLV
jgi:hypothetical protein